MTKVNPNRKRDHEYPKVRSDNMSALLTVDKALAELNPDSPPVNKRNTRLMADVTKAEAVAANLINVGDLINMEIDRHQLKNSTGVNLDDCKEVMERTRDYFYACAAAKNPPSMLTYCSIGLGLTRNRVADYCRKHSNATTEFITRVTDLIADQISTGAMYGNLDNIMAIFQLKNLHGFADNVRIEAAMQEQAPEIDEDALKQEYMKYAKENGIKVDE